DRHLRSFGCDQICRPRTQALQKFNQLIHADHVPLKIEHKCALALRQETTDEYFSNIANVLQVHVTGYADLETLAEHDCSHGESRIRSQPTIPAHTVNGPRAQAYAGDPIRVVENARIPFISLLEDSV